MASEENEVQAPVEAAIDGNIEDQIEGLYDNTSYSVACVCCGDVFAGYSQTQALACSSHFAGDTIRIGSASRHMEISDAMHFKPELPVALQGKPEGQVCDDCIAWLSADPAVRPRCDADWGTGDDSDAADDSDDGDDGDDTVAPSGPMDPETAMLLSLLDSIGNADKGTGDADGDTTVGAAEPEETDDWDEVPETIEVVCSCCGTSFEGMFPTQAHRCASDIRGNLIHGHYGSVVADMEEIEFSNPEGESHLADGVICDLCIKKLQVSGRVIRIGGLLYRPPMGR